MFPDGKVKNSSGSAFHWVHVDMETPGKAEKVLQKIFFLIISREASKKIAKQRI